jgi:D-alanyl-D-alanine carboxypeptidase/D-alanyl-D-alanine-endopeptidase (penicillin-binding protein 4)
LNLSRYVLVIIALGLLSISPTRVSSQEGPATSPHPLGPSLQKILDRAPSSLRDATVGIAVVDLLTGQTVFEQNADQRMSAASNVKLITASAALDTLGPHYRFRTEVLAERVDGDRVKGDIILRGRGNPGLGVDEMDALVRDLRLAGIRQVDGGIVVDNTFFDGENAPPHYDEQPDETAAFRAPIAATAYSFNSWTVEIRPALDGHGPARIEVIPACDYLRVESTVTTVARGRNRLRLDTKEESDHLALKLSGQIRADTRSRRFRERIPDPLHFAGSGFAASLARAGISLRKKRIKAGQASEEAQLLAVHESPPLAVMVRGMGKYSNNFVAEMLFKSLGAERSAGGEGATWKHAQSAVEEFLVRRVGLKKGSFRVDNGSGLFDASELSPRQLTRVLAFATREFRWGPDLLASLSIGGADGTLSRRMTEGEERLRVRAKTGTLAQVSALSGLAAVDGRKPLVFSILVNGFDESKVNQARDLQDELAASMVHFQLKSR